MNHQRKRWLLTRLASRCHQTKEIDHDKALVQASRLLQESRETQYPTSQRKTSLSLCKMNSIVYHYPSHTDCALSRCHILRLVSRRNDTVSTLEGRRRTRVFIRLSLQYWLDKDLVSPQTTLMTFCSNEFSMLLYFLQDYCSKALSSYMPREYICLQGLQAPSSTSRLLIHSATTSHALIELLIVIGESTKILSGRIPTPRTACHDVHR